MSGLTALHDIVVVDISLANTRALSPDRLPAPDQRRIDAISRDLAVGVASGAETTDGTGVPKTISASVGPAGTCIALWSGHEPEQVLAFTEATARNPDESLLVEGFDDDRAPRLLVVVDGNVLWWAARNEPAALAIVGHEGLVHVVMNHGEDVRCELLEDGDRIAVICPDLCTELADVELALEMALVDDPPPSSAVEWLLSAACDDGSRLAHRAAVWRHVGLP